jgi:hypothetical protein
LYVKNRPLLFVDPSGRQTLADWGLPVGEQDLWKKVPKPKSKNCKISCDDLSERLGRHWADGALVIYDKDDTLTPDWEFILNQPGMAKSIKTTIPYLDSGVYDDDGTSTSMQRIITKMEAYHRNGMRFRSLVIMEHSQNRYQTLGNRVDHYLNANRLLRPTSERWRRLSRLVDEDGAIILMGCFLGANRSLLTEYANEAGRTVWACTTAPIVSRRLVDKVEMLPCCTGEWVLAVPDRLRMQELSDSIDLEVP